ncbi:hypothetical protein, partial [Devosia limi]|uniref:hypothetical protein n=1 Tax=Devosia limi TaxID=288995 RepID=UPI001AEC6BDE
SVRGMPVGVGSPAPGGRHRQYRLKNRRPWFGPTKNTGAMARLLPHFIADYPLGAKASPSPHFGYEVPRISR